ncbi:phosphate acetyltransferase [Borreliella burgdorferi]|uniref:Phosphate acetyltransferase n=2 Tax=Borreliella burgdorferi TaxID=139 RepID=PTAS_BORBU|nr:RecName: Full=Phosphate acetyltransferase; AltName: Full=Phosphotransacetylase [Borreliella burgdorferi B31]AGS66590.1 phosphate acetyltransferase [Borreliella burgdorferi CA382]ARS30339.1 phosphate acetyltransferase [Borreliella burgdorferi]ARS31570.1 phosphate acetyltransferase [Borreliella burgdorferi]ARS33317.1 phosphate acetyltransferase [Borreliella burgdorferi]PNL87685.1 phosphate acetyltransferase [Borreliella burgdorferi]
MLYSFYKVFCLKDYVFKKARIFVKENKLKANIVFPESSDSRVLKAAIVILQKNLADSIILIGKKDTVINSLKEFSNCNDILGRIEVVDPNSFPDIEMYLDEYWSLQKLKGVTKQSLKTQVLDEITFAMLMVRFGYAKSCVCGAVSTSAKVLSNALRIIPKLEGVKIISSFMIMDTLCTARNVDFCFGHNGILFFADCSVVVNPNSLELAEIALQSAKSFKDILNAKPKVALLSFSTKGSSSAKETEKVKNALNIVRNKESDLLIDGELQLDSAIIKDVAEKKCRESLVAGSANVLIFPNLDAGNIGYKLVERFAFAKAYGPFLQGFSKPISDLSRGCSVDEIVFASALMISI